VSPISLILSPNSLITELIKKEKTKPKYEDASQPVPVKYEQVLNSALSWSFSGQMDFFLALRVISGIISFKVYA